MTPPNADLLAGRRFHDSGRWDLAERYLRAGLGGDPTSANDHALLARALVNLNRDWPARVEIEEATRLDPQSLVVLNARVDVLMRLGDMPGALDAAHELVARAPASSSARATLAFALYRAGRPRQALDVSVDALRLDPANIEAKNALAVALIKSGYAADGEAALLDAMRDLPDDPALQNNLGLAQWQDGRVKPATESFLEALRSDPENRTAHANLTRLYGVPMLAVIAACHRRGRGRWAAWPIPLQAMTIGALALLGLVGPFGPAFALILGLWTVSGTISRRAPLAVHRAALALEPISISLLLPTSVAIAVTIGLSFARDLEGVDGAASSAGVSSGLLLPIALGAIGHLSRALAVGGIIAAVALSALVQGLGPAIVLLCVIPLIVAIAEIRRGDSTR
jgi:tetratricopeptide (TPR) repeat protein